MMLAIQLILTMKPSQMRTPVIADIFQQKLTYEKHIKKLDRIREERRNQLQYDHSRTTQMQLLKEGKSKTFANRFNEQNLQINQSNIKLLSKLQKAKPFTRYTSYSSYERPRDNSHSFLKPVTRRKIIETEKENSRIFFKMKSVSSSLSKDRMLDDYAKAQKIKSRITKYAVENNKIALKSEKYFSLNKSSISNRSLDSNQFQKAKSNLVNHYRKEDIIKNRISNTDHKLFKTKRDHRNLPSLRTKEPENESINVEDNAFFTTEPLKNKRSATTRKLG